MHAHRHIHAYGRMLRVDGCAWRFVPVRWSICPVAFRLFLLRWTRYYRDYGCSESAAPSSCERCLGPRFVWSWSAIRRQHARLALAAAAEHAPSQEADSTAQQRASAEHVRPGTAGAARWHGHCRRRCQRQTGGSPPPHPPTHTPTHTHTHTLAIRLMPARLLSCWRIGSTAGRALAAAAVHRSATRGHRTTASTLATLATRNAHLRRVGVCGAVWPRG